MVTWIKFCEPTYTRFENVAELWNTLSSFAYCIPALILAFQTRKYRTEFPNCFTTGVYWRFMLCATSWFALGLGSAAFHALQTVWAELWDEIGMLVATLSISFCLFDLHPLTTSRKANWFYGSLILLTVSTILVYVQIMYHPFFATCFMISALIPLFISLTLPINLNMGPVKLYHEKHIRETRAAISARENASKTIDSMSVFGSMKRNTSLLLGIGISIVGYGIWHIDQKCVRDDWKPSEHGMYELDWFYWCHPLWHVCTALGSLFFFDAMSKVRVESYHSSLLRRDGTGSFISVFSVASSLKLLLGIRNNKSKPQ